VTGTDETDLLRLAGAVERASEHAIGRAVAEHAEGILGPLPEVADFTAMPGLGAKGRVGNVEVVVERPDGVPTELAVTVADWESVGRTVVAVRVDRALAGVVALVDPVAEGSRAAVEGLRARGLRPVLLTGDSEAAARYVAAATGIEEVHARVLPDDKVRVVKELQASGAVVAMVGDGVNDAAALAAADLGIAVGSGTDVALEAADMVLVRDDLRALTVAVDLARATLGTIRGNLLWAFGYNIAAIPLAAAGLLNPLLAGAAMALSSLLVVTNSLRLRTVGGG
jgi:cation-transporting P-type ATPase A/B/Cu+-exporting ATPase